MSSQTQLNESHPPALPTGAPRFFPNVGRGTVARVFAGDSRVLVRLGWLELRNRYRARRDQRHRHARRCDDGNSCHAFDHRHRLLCGRGRKHEPSLRPCTARGGARFGLDRPGLGRGRASRARIGAGAVATRGGFWPRRAGLRAAASRAFGACLFAAPRAAGYPDLIAHQTQENPF